MKNLSIIQTPIRFTPAIGGVENHVYYLSKNLVKSGTQVTVICANEPESTIQQIDGITVKRLPYFFKITNTNICFSLAYNILSTPYQLMHTHMPTPWSSDISIILAKLTRKKSIITIHNDMDKPGFFSKVLTKAYLNTVFRLSLLLVDKIIIVNPSWKQSFIATKRILEQYEEKIVVVPNGIDIELFKPKKENLKKKSNTILFISLLDIHHKFKGLDYLLEAIAQIKEKNPTVKLQVIGEGELKKYYQNMAKKLNISRNVEFVGRVTQEDLPKYYNNASMFVLPSIEIEGFGIVILEAMACGLPVIATNIVGTSTDIIKHKTGIVVKPRESKALASAITKLQEDKNLAAQYGRNGRSLIEKKYDWRIIAKQIEEIYRKESL